MRIRWILASSILVALLVIGATTRISLGNDAAQVDTQSMMLESTTDALSGDECVSPEATELMEIDDPGTAAYECPRGVPYCQRASQCADYCGGGFEVCSRGCCACSG